MAIPLWSDTIADEEFKKQPFEIKERVVNNYLEMMKKDDPSFAIQTDSIQEQVRQKLLDTVRPPAPSAYSMENVNSAMQLAGEGISSLFGGWKPYKPLTEKEFEEKTAKFAVAATPLGPAVKVAEAVGIVPEGRIEKAITDVMASPLGKPYMAITRVLAGGISEYLGGLPEFIAGKVPEAPQGEGKLAGAATVAETVAGAGARVAGWVAGPLGMAKAAFKGTLATVKGSPLALNYLRTVAKSGLEMGVAGWISEVLPAIGESPDVTEASKRIASSAGSMAILGLAFPLMGAVPTKPLRVAVGVPLLDYVMNKGQFTLDDFVDNVAKGVKGEKVDLKELSQQGFNHILNAYFLTKTPSVRKQLETLIPLSNTDKLAKVAMDAADAKGDIAGAEKIAGDLKAGLNAARKAHPEEFEGFDKAFKTETESVAADITTGKTEALKLALGEMLKDWKVEKPTVAKEGKVVEGKAPVEVIGSWKDLESHAKEYVTKSAMESAFYMNKAMETQVKHEAFIGGLMDGIKKMEGNAPKQAKLAAEVLLEHEVMPDAALQRIVDRAKSLGTTIEDAVKGSKITGADYLVERAKRLQAWSKKIAGMKWDALIEEGVEEQLPFMQRAMAELEVRAQKVPELKPYVDNWKMGEVKAPSGTKAFTVARIGPDKGTAGTFYGTNVKSDVEWGIEAKTQTLVFKPKDKLLDIETTEWHEGDAGGAPLADAVGFGNIKLDVDLQRYHNELIKAYKGQPSLLQEEATLAADSLGALQAKRDGYAAVVLRSGGDPSKIVIVDLRNHSVEELEGLVKKSFEEPSAMEKVEAPKVVEAAKIGVPKGISAELDKLNKQYRTIVDAGGNAENIAKKIRELEDILVEAKIKAPSYTVQEARTLLISFEEEVFPFRDIPEGGDAIKAKKLDTTLQRWLRKMPEGEYKDKVYESMNRVRLAEETNDLNRYSVNLEVAAEHMHAWVDNVVARARELAFPPSKEPRKPISTPAVTAPPIEEGLTKLTPAEATKRKMEVQALNIKPVPEGFTAEKADEHIIPAIEQRAEALAKGDKAAAKVLAAQIDDMKKAYWQAVDKQGTAGMLPGDELANAWKKIVKAERDTLKLEEPEKSNVIDFIMNPEDAELLKETPTPEDLAKIEGKEWAKKMVEMKGKTVEEVDAEFKAQLAEMAQEPTAKPPKGPKMLISEEQYKADQKKLNEGGTLLAGVPTELMGPLVRSAVYHIERSKAAADFYTWAQWVKKEVNDPAIEKYLHEAWKAGVAQHAGMAKAQEEDAKIGDVTKAVKTRRGAMIASEVDYKNVLHSTVDIAGGFMGGKWLNPYRMLPEMACLNPGTGWDRLMPEYNAIETKSTLERRAFADALDKQLKLAGGGTASNRIGIDMIAEQEGSAEFLNLMNIKELPKLNPREIAGKKWIRSMFDKWWIGVNDVRKANGLSPIAYRADYFTYWVVDKYMRQKGKDILTVTQSDFDRAMKDVRFIHPKETPFQFKKRMIDIGYLDTNAFRVLERYGNSAIRHINFTPFATKINALYYPFTATKVKGAGEDPYGDANVLVPKDASLQLQVPNFAKALMGWKDFILGIPPPSILDGAPTTKAAISALRTNLVWYTLSYSNRFAVSQFASPVNTAGLIGGPRTTLGMMKALSPAQAKRAISTSDTLMARSQQIDVVIKDAIEYASDKRYFRLGKLGEYAFKAHVNVAEFGLKLGLLGDYYNAVGAWLGAESYAKSVLKMTDSRLIKEYADDIVLSTQASALPGHIAPIQRTAEGRTLTTFQTFTINQWGCIVHDIIGIKNPSVSKVQMIKNLSWFLLGWGAVNFMFEDVLNVDSVMPTPLRKFAFSLAQGDNIGIAALKSGAEISGFAPMIGGWAKYGSSPLGAVVDVLGKTGGAVAGVKGPRPSALDIAGQWLGVPGGGQLRKSIRQAKNPEATLYDVFMGTYPKQREMMIKGILEEFDKPDKLQEDAWRELEQEWEKIESGMEEKF